MNLDYVLKMDLSLQPFLENDLVRLHPLMQSDFDFLYAAASDPLIWEQHQNYDRFTLENFTVFFNEAIASKGALAIIDVKSSAVIGSSRFRIIDESNGVIEIGWSFLAKKYWGGNYNRQFKILMINYALQYFKSVIFYVNLKNHRSQKAMEKLGAKKMTFPGKPWVLKENVGITYTIDSPLKV